MLLAEAHATVIASRRVVVGVTEDQATKINYRSNLIEKKSNLKNPKLNESRRISHFFFS